jgi:hypothetical protein
LRRREVKRVARRAAAQHRRAVLAKALRVVAIACVIGVAAALRLPFISGMLFGVSPGDPATGGVVAVVALPRWPRVARVRPRVEPMRIERSEPNGLRKTFHSCARSRAASCTRSRRLRAGRCDRREHDGVQRVQRLVPAATAVP